jgi:hypothetical protein
MYLNKNSFLADILYSFHLADESIPKIRAENIYSVKCESQGFQNKNKDLASAKTYFMDHPKTGN